MTRRKANVNVYTPGNINRKKSKNATFYFSCESQTGFFKVDNSIETKILTITKENLQVVRSHSSVENFKNLQLLLHSLNKLDEKRENFLR